MSVFSEPTRGRSANRVGTWMDFCLIEHFLSPFISYSRAKVKEFVLERTKC
jgi:hypothetical protein